VAIVTADLDSSRYFLCPPQWHFVGSAHETSVKECRLIRNSYVENANLKIDATDPTQLRGHFKIASWYAPQ
jgi:hypothetical protein